jgi:hypothetical protein
MTAHPEAVAATMFSGGVLITEEPLVEPRAEAVAPPSITTEAGRYLRAIARYESSGAGGVADREARRIWKIAFGLAVRRRFEPGAPLAEIARTVATAVREHAAAALPMLDAEMLLRAELGEEVPLDEIDPAIEAAVHVLMFATLADELALGDDELDGLIRQAEA